MNEEVGSKQGDSRVINGSEKFVGKAKSPTLNGKSSKKGKANNG